MAYITEKSIFYHIPKTGRWWVVKAMRETGMHLRKISSAKKEKIRI